MHLDFPLENNRFIIIRKAVKTFLHNYGNSHIWSAAILTSCISYFYLFMWMKYDFKLTCLTTLSLLYMRLHLEHYYDAYFFSEMLKHLETCYVHNKKNWKDRNYLNYKESVKCEIYFMNRFRASFMINTLLIPAINRSAGSSKADMIF